MKSLVSGKFGTQTQKVKLVGLFVLSLNYRYRTRVWQGNIFRERLRRRALKKPSLRK